MSISDTNPIHETHIRRWKPYPAYKSSGVEWLGEIPKHWEMKPFKYMVSCPVEKGDGQRLPFVALEHIISGEGRLIQDFEWEIEPADEYAIFRSGDVLFGKLRPYLRKYLLTDRRGCCPTELLIFRPIRNVIWSSYLFFMMDSAPFIALADSTSYGVKMPRTSWEIIGAAHLWLPSLPEQRAIASFLDQETAHIDALIAKKECLIELLQEKRSALISQAVTQGLEPGVKLKDSGVEWLGKIPEGWEVKRLKDITAINTEALPENISSDYLLQYVDISNVDSNGSIIGLQEMTFENAPSRARRIVRDQDTIISTVRAYLKAIAFIESPPDNMIVSTGFAVLHPRLPVNPRFLCRMVQSTQFVDAVVSHSEGVSYPAIAPTRLGCLPVWLPPLPEQQAIAAFIDCETAKIDVLIDKIRQHIEKLKEFRAALITAAVTGKIDVREEHLTPRPPLPDAASPLGEGEPSLGACTVTWLPPLRPGEGGQGGEVP